MVTRGSGTVPVTFERAARGSRAGSMRPMSRSITAARAAAVLSLLALPVFALAPRPAAPLAAATVSSLAAPAGEKAVTFDVEALDGGVERGVAFTFDAAEGAVFEPARLVRTGAATPPATRPDPDAVELTLWNGDALVGAIDAAATDLERLGLALGDGGGRGDLGAAAGEGDREDDDAAPQVLRVPIDALARVSFDARRAAAGAEELEAPETGDRLYRLAGTGVDVLDGTLDGFDADGLSFESSLGLRSYAWSEVVALFVEPLDPPESTRGEPGAVAVDLVGGGRLHGELLAVTRDELRLRLPWDEVFATALASVRLVGRDDGTIRYLSERGPDSIEGGSAFGDDLGHVFRPAIDRAVHGAPLVAGERTWPRGIGVQSPTNLVFELTEAEAKGRTLRGFVAIDASTADLGAAGAAVFVVRVDGREHWRSEVVRGGRAPIAIPELSFDGAARLELDLEMGPDLNLGDRGDWLDLRLVRAGD